MLMFHYDVRALAGIIVYMQQTHSLWWLKPFKSENPDVASLYKYLHIPPELQFENVAFFYFHLHLQCNINSIDDFLIDFLLDQSLVWSLLFYQASLTDLKQMSRDRIIFYFALKKRFETRFALCWLIQKFFFRNHLTAGNDCCVALIMIHGKMLYN